MAQVDERLIAEIAKLIDSVGSDTCFPEMVGFLGQEFPHDLYLITANVRGTPPRLLSGTHQTKERGRANYFNKIYLLDPIHNALEGGVLGCWRISDLAPDNFKCSEYYRVFYAVHGIADELSWLIDIGGGLRAVVSLCRTNEQCVYTKADLEHARKLLPLIESVIRCWLTMRGDFLLNPITPSDKSFAATFQEAFRRFATSLLTNREVEITHLLLKGHSPASIANVIGRSAGTVRNHLASVYHKLNISSQAELFGLFTEALTTLEAASNMDPLEQFEFTNSKTVCEKV